MYSLTDWLRPRWPVLAFLASAALLAAAHAYERFGGLAPCPLCLDQRERHWAVLAIAAAAFVVTLLLKRPNLQRIAAAIIGLALAWAAYEAGHHVAVENKWIPATCDAEINLDNLVPLDPNASFEPPKCDVPTKILFGISMATYNFMISLALCLLSFVIAIAPNRKSENV